MRIKSGKNYLVIGQTLIMYNLDPMDTDRYTCVARNFAGVRTATTTLKVHGMKFLCFVFHSRVLDDFISFWGTTLTND